MPVSSAAIRGPSPSPSKTRGSGIVTSRARSRPTMLGSAAIRSRASASLISPGKTPPRIAPASRMWRTSARVSTPSMPGIPLSRSQSSQPLLLTAARMIAARAWMRSDSIAAALTRRSCRCAGR